MVEVFSSSPVSEDMWDYHNDKIKPQLITRETKSGSASSSCLLQHYQEESCSELMSFCHFETKKRLFIVWQERQFEKIIHSNSAINWEQLDFQNYIKFCDIFSDVCQWFNPVLYYLNPTVVEFNQSSFKPGKRVSSLGKDQTRPQTCLCSV